MKIIIHTSKEGAEAALKLLGFVGAYLDANADIMSKKGIKHIEKLHAWTFKEKLSIGLRRAQAITKHSK